MRKAVLLMAFLSLFISTPTVFAAKRVEINLPEQQLSAFEDDRPIYQFTVSTGKRRTPTPNGAFKPWIKLTSTRMRGPGYDLKNVPYVVYFYNEQTPKLRGYGIHGTYWHNRFGTPMSHGCINLKTSDAAQLYSWIDMDTTIYINGQTP
jgi:lipoprotein-anchoring transpeptidase ErfK/SrfK